MSKREVNVKVVATPTSYGAYPTVIVDGAVDTVIEVKHQAEGGDIYTPLFNACRHHVNITCKRENWKLVGYETTITERLNEGLNEV